MALRMLGSRGEADDAVQEAWLRLDRASPEGVDNLGAWLTTVVARICLDVLRARRSHAEEPLAVEAPDGGVDVEPDAELRLADSVGLALLVVLETLAPAERLAFVLHDLVDVPFDEIAPIVRRSPEATRQLASRARRHVRGAAATAEADRASRRRVVEAFLAASRGRQTSRRCSRRSPPTSCCAPTVAAVDAAAARARRSARRRWRSSLLGGARTPSPRASPGPRPRRAVRPRRWRSRGRLGRRPERPQPSSRSPSRATQSSPSTSSWTPSACGASRSRCSKVILAPAQPRPSWSPKRGSCARWRGCPSCRRRPG